MQYQNIIFISGCVRSGTTERLRDASKIEENREATLSSKDKLWILNNADFESYRKLYQ